MKEKIETFLKEWENKDRPNSNSYDNCHIINDNFDEVEFDEELYKILKSISNLKYDYTYIGGFDSCGYSISCYCLTIIDEKGNLISYPINFECF